MFVCVYDDVSVAYGGFGVTSVIHHNHSHSFNDDVSLVSYAFSS